MQSEGGTSRSVPPSTIVVTKVRRGILKVRERPGRLKCPTEGVLRTRGKHGEAISPMRLLEMLVDRFGAFEVIAATALELSRKHPDECLPMDRRTAEAILEFGDDLRQAAAAVA